MLGTKWFLDYSLDVNAIPQGHSKLLYINSVPGPSPQEIQDLVAQAPGSVWYIVGEPNRRAGYAAGDIVDQLHDLYVSIKAADPTALITSPSVLNWDYTCLRPEYHGCSWDLSGREWVEDFRATYLTTYGEEPPVDIWAIDAYPLDWLHLPTVNAQIPIDQISGMRQYLDAIPAHRGKPIWVTEFSLHWGYNCPEPALWPAGCFDFSSDGISPRADAVYQEGAVLQYLTTVYDWLEQNSAPMNIQKWFTFKTYADLLAPTTDGFAGLSLFNSPAPGANLTPVGELFFNRVLQ